MPLALNTSLNDQEPLVARPMMRSELLRRRTSMPCFWEIALFDACDNETQPQVRRWIVGPARSRLRRAFSSPCVIAMAGAWPWFLVIMPAGGLCPYYTHERCFHCDIGAGEGRLST